MLRLVSLTRCIKGFARSILDKMCYGVVIPWETTQGLKIYSSWAATAAPGEGPSPNSLPDLIVLVQGGRARCVEGANLHPGGEESRTCVSTLVDSGWRKRPQGL